MSSGRQKYKRYKKLILLTSSFLSVFPNFILQFFWDIIRPYSQLPFIFFRYVILKAKAKNCGDNIRIGTNVTIKGWGNLVLGSNISIHDNCYIDAGGNIVVGNNVSIAHNSTLLSGTHTFNDKNVPIKYNPIIKDGLSIANDVWIGCGVRVLSGIKVSSRSIIAAGAVVNKNVDKNSIYGGIPAKKIKDI